MANCNLLSVMLSKSERLGITFLSNRSRIPIQRFTDSRTFGWGSNGCIPDSTAYNPARTSVSLMLVPFLQDRLWHWPLLYRKHSTWKWWSWKRLEMMKGDDDQITLPRLAPPFIIPLPVFMVIRLSLGFDCRDHGSCSLHAFSRRIQ
jgi:hypothetical protein